MGFKVENGSVPTSKSCYLKVSLYCYNYRIALYEFELTLRFWKAPEVTLGGAYGTAVLCFWAAKLSFWDSHLAFLVGVLSRMDVLWYQGMEIVKATGEQNHLFLFTSGWNCVRGELFKANSQEIICCWGCDAMLCFSNLTAEKGHGFLHHQKIH